MKDVELGTIATTFALLSVVAFGGANATIPEIHRQVVDHLHWLSNVDFGELIAMAQAAPGPNVLIASLIGWQVAGLAGLAIATLAMNIPSSILALVAGRSLVRHGDTNFVRLAQRALAPIAVALILASGAVMARVIDRTIVAGLITTIMGLLVFFTRLNPLWGIAASAALGILFGRFELF